MKQSKILPIIKTLVNKRSLRTRANKWNEGEKKPTTLTITIINKNESFFSKKA